MKSLGWAAINFSCFSRTDVCLLMRQVFKGSLWRYQFTVAIKEITQPRLLEPRAQEKMDREMECLANIHSPFVTQFIGACYKPRLMLVMEYCAGGSLYDAIGNNEMGLFTWYKRCTALSQEFLHQRSRPLC